MGRIAGVDPLGRIADHEVRSSLQARGGLQHRDALLFRGAGIDGRFVHHDRPRPQRLADGSRGRKQRTQIRVIGIVDRGRNGDDEEVDALQIVGFGGEADPASPQDLGLDLAGPIMAIGEFRQPRTVDVEARHGPAMSSEARRNRQPHIAQANDADMPAFCHACLYYCTRRPGPERSGACRLCSLSQAPRGVHRFMSGSVTSDDEQRSILALDPTSGLCFASPPAPARACRHGRGRWLLRCLGFGLALIAIPPAVMAISLLHFLWIIDRGERAPENRAEAIVALSGDPSRITQAVQLLASGHGQSLFITGVDNEDEVLRQRRLQPDLFACCIDVDHGARDTKEDAAAIARWAKARHVHSLLVVTSSPHLPRAIIEINDALPGVQTFPSAVVKGLYDYRDWRSDPASWPWFAREYVKSIGALLRNRFPWLWPASWDRSG